MASMDPELDICFKDVHWLNANLLNPDTVMAYFSLSPFYDRECNNERIKMDRRLIIRSSEEFTRELRKLEGIEYVLAKDQYPVMYIIHKMRRESENSVKLVSSYYIMEGTIYKCPDLYTILASRLATSSYFIQKALLEATRRSTFHAVNGYEWTIPESVKPAGASHDEPVKLITKESIEFQNRVDGLIGSLQQISEGKMPEMPKMPSEPSKATPFAGITAGSKTPTAAGASALSSSAAIGAAASALSTTASASAQTPSAAAVASSAAAQAAAPATKTAAKRAAPSSSAAATKAAASGAVEEKATKRRKK